MSYSWITIKNDLFILFTILCLHCFLNSMRHGQTFDPRYMRPVKERTFRSFCDVERASFSRGQPLSNAICDQSKSEHSDNFVTLSEPVFHDSNPQRRVWIPIYSNGVISLLHGVISLLHGVIRLLHGVIRLLHGVINLLQGVINLPPSTPWSR
jgi:hypothetical protein